MDGVSDDLLTLIGGILGCGLKGILIKDENHILAHIGAADSSGYVTSVSSKSFHAELYTDSEPVSDDFKTEQIKKIINIYLHSHSGSAGQIFSGSDIIETIINKKSIDDVIGKLTPALLEKSGFCCAGVLFLNETLMELRGVYYTGKSAKADVESFRKTKVLFKTKNTLSDVMFYDKTTIADLTEDKNTVHLTDYFKDKVLATALTGAGGEPIGVLLACKDSYTARDSADLSMYGNMFSLSIEFSKTAKQLELALAEIKNIRQSNVNSENLVKMGRLSATVAHELKNPLVAIGGFTKRMEQTAVNPQTKNYIKIVQSEVQRLERIVGDILLYSRKIELEIVELRLWTLVYDVMEVLKNCLSFNMINVNVKVKPDQMIHADRDKMKQVLMNLVSNGVQEMPDGGELKIEVSESDKHVTITVSDTGTGIPVDKREKIFEPFYTLKKNGTGLGLPLCKKIMTAHGGDIMAADGENGAAFVLVLPKRG